MRIPSRLGALALALALAFSTESCSYLLGDPYGNYLQKVDAWVDLRTMLQAATGLTLDNVYAMDVAEGTYLGTTYRHAFLMCDFTNNTGSLHALDYNNLALSSYSFSPSTPWVFSASATLDGDIRIGSSTYRADLALSTGNSLVSPSWPAWTLREGSTYNDLVYSDGSNMLHIDCYDGAWAAQTTNTWQISSTGSWQLARARLLADGRVCLLFIMGNGGQGSIRAACFPDFATFRAAFVAAAPALMDSAVAGLSEVMPLNSNNGSYNNPSGVSAWLTADGAVSLTDQGNNSFTFQRYPYSPGSAIDKYVLSANYDELIYFEDTGNYWYRFDRVLGRLYRLRTWWK
jgi:hypothetical protein